MKKKFFICLLSLLMVFTMMPAMAMANESEENNQFAGNVR